MAVAVLLADGPTDADFVVGLDVGTSDPARGIAKIGREAWCSRDGCQAKLEVRELDGSDFA